MGKIDLHVHSTASDGRLSPEEIVRKAEELRLSAMALTDHDSVDGIAPALRVARTFPRLKFIPGVEVSTDVPSGEVHVLGYFIDYNNHELLASLARFRNSRQARAQGIIAKLADFGIRIEWSRVLEIAGDGSVGRPHIARAMLEKGYITSIKEAFDKYISRDGPAYVEREKMTPAEAAELIVRTDGLPVMAHPFTVADPEAMIVELKAAGLAGIEAYYNGYTADETSQLVRLAEEHGLIVTGGSDYHGLGGSDETDMGGTAVPEDSVEQLIALAKKRNLELASL